MKGLNDITLQADTIGINLVGLTNDGPIHMGCVTWQEVHKQLKYYAIKDRVMNHTPEEGLELVNWR